MKKEKTETLLVGDFVRVKKEFREDFKIYQGLIISMRRSNLSGLDMLTVMCDTGDCANLYSDEVYLITEQTEQ